jgi:CSLREA domain-containing protein
VFTVDSAVDAVDANPGDGACASSEDGCTLRAAVMEANALPGDDVIHLYAGAPGVPAPALSIQGASEDAAATGDLDIIGKLSIVGEGMALSGADASALGDRAVHVLPGSHLSLSGLSFVWADAGPGQNGGGILNEGTVSMVETSFQSNRAHNGAGVMNVGEMTLLRSLIGFNTATDAGAGIRNDGTLTIEASTIANNEVLSGPGGGIENHGTLVIRNSTVSQNRASNRAAGILNNAGATARINNATIIYNLIDPDGTGLASTGGIFNEEGGSVQISNSILAINADDWAFPDADCMGTVLSGGFNLFGESADCILTGDTPDDLVGVDPLLPALPTVDPAQTWGYPPLAGSPAIDAGNPAPVGSSDTACEIADQRGFARPIGFACDIGAYESEFGAVGTPSFTPTSTDTPSPTATSSPTPTPTRTLTATLPTRTPSVTPTKTPTRTSTFTPSATATDTPTVTPTPTPTATSSNTATASSTTTPSLTASATPNLTPTPVFGDDFESGDLTAWSSAQVDQGDLSVTSAAAIGGSFGLQAVLDDNRAIYVVDDEPEAETAYDVRFYFDPNSIQMQSGNAHVLLLARDATGVAAFRIEVRSFQGDYQLRAVAPLDNAPAYASPWVALTDSPHVIEVEWWAATPAYPTSGRLLFWVDWKAGVSRYGLANLSRRVDSVRFGAVSGIDSGTRGMYYFDSFASNTGWWIGPDPSIVLPAPTPPPDLIFADDFESGDLTPWSAVKNDGDLSVNAAAAMDGDFGLEAVLDDTVPLFVTDWSPVAEPEYRARFLFDPNTLVMLDGRAHYIFQALMGSSQVLARVEVRYKSGNYELRSGILSEGTGWVNTSWWYITDGPQTIEIGWRASASAEIPDGSLTMRINEVQSESRVGIRNDNQRIDFIRWGAVAGIDAGTLGSMYFDAFESRRETYIGPPSGP